MRREAERRMKSSCSCSRHGGGREMGLLWRRDMDAEEIDFVGIWWKMIGQNWISKIVLFG